MNNRNAANDPNFKLFEEIETNNYKTIVSKNTFTNQKKFTYIAIQFIEYQKTRLECGEITEQSYKTLKNRFLYRVIPYFENFYINQVNTGAITNFVSELRKSASAYTTKKILQQLQMFLRYANEIGEIQYAPPVPKIKVKTPSRGSFSINEYIKLLRAAKTLANIENIPAKITHRNTANSIFVDTESVPKEMAWLIGFMVNSFVRPVDVKLIQHKHIEVIRGKYTYLRLTLPETKLHNSQIVTLQPAVRIYEHLKAYMAREGLDKEDDYLFLPKIKNRSSAIKILSVNFNKCMTYAGIRKNQLDQNRTLYSLRHTSIMFRLLYGNSIDLLTLARNARTSVEMIEKFYARNLNAEMNIGLIQSKR